MSLRAFRPVVCKDTARTANQTLRISNNSDSEFMPTTANALSLQCLQTRKSIGWPRPILLSPLPKSGESGSAGTLCRATWPTRAASPTSRPRAGQWTPPRSRQIPNHCRTRISRKACRARSRTRPLSGTEFLWCLKHPSRSKKRWCKNAASRDSSLSQRQPRLSLAPKWKSQSCMSMTANERISL